ncbi:hypothetical protein [Staphylococcus cornubiensis]|uniref:hypothetical protein n=1 Tax=Staphylococcus cornubiensis TaxID=1986155 RepID=UPI000A37E8D1|nr:hypothetical protein [Staphylococcus cornubiensis]
MKMDGSILKGTIEEFSKGKKELLINQYTNMIDNDAIKQLQMKDESEIINDLIENEFEMLLSAYRKMEYAQSYKYSAIFKIMSTDVMDLLKVLKNNENLKIGSNDYFGYYNEEDKYFILNFKRVGITLKDNKAVTKERVQSAIVKYHSLGNEGYFEVSIDNIPNYYRKDSTNYYLNVIDEIINWISRKLLIKCLPVNLNFTIEKMRKEDTSDFLISAQLMNTTKGARATLETASSTTIILPILGEIKEIIESNKNLFENSQEGLKILTDYITELEEESDLPWVSLINKTNNISIKFLFESYTGRDYTLLNYYYHEKRREGMDYVLQKILSEYHQRSVTRSETDTSAPSKT